MQSLSTPMSYHRLNRNPLDDMEVFSNLRDLMNYCDTGARYDGQRVAVLNDEFSIMEYVIKNNLPMIDMKGSEPIFRSNITFSGDAAASHGLLIYQHNGNGLWNQSDVFCTDENKLSLINQLEIFRILDAAGNKTFKFYMERQIRDTSTIDVSIWNQNYNPYNDGSSNPISQSVGATVTGLSFNAVTNAWLRTNNSSIYLMPRTTTGVNAEANIITSIYVKAEDYYNAWK